MLKRTLLSTAVTVALGLSAGHANAVLMDLTGASGAGGNSDVATLDWLPGNALAIGALSTPTLANGGPSAAGQRPNEQYLRNVAQGRLGSFGLATDPDNPVAPAAGREFTFQASFYTFTSGIGTSTVSNRIAPGESWFRLYADNANSSSITGAGFGDGTMILEGRLSSLRGAFTDLTREPNDPNNFGQTDLLDSFGADNQNGVRSHRGNGSNTLGIDITWLNGNYFLGDIAALLLTLNYGDTTNLATPFGQTNPSDSVVGETPHYSIVGGSKVNGALCSQGTNETGSLGVTGRCDFHFQSDASGAFVNRVPEPGSLALAGLALSALGFAGRRRKTA